MSGQLGGLAVTRRIGRKLLLLTLKSGQSGLDLTSPTLVLAQRDDAAQVSLCQPIAMMITCVGAGYVMFRFGVTLGD